MPLPISITPFGITISGGLGFHLAGTECNYLGDLMPDCTFGHTGFTGTTYSEAVAYMKEQGVSGASAAGIKTSSEFKRSEDSREYNSYNEYLQYIVDVKTSESKKK